MTRGQRVVAFVAVALVVVASAAGFVVASALRDQAAAPAGLRSSARQSRPAPVNVEAVSAQPHVVFRNTRLDDSYGLVAMAALASPDGARAFTDVTCDRVDATAARAVCLRTRRGVVTGFEAQIRDARWELAGAWPLPGTPSRTRLSADSGLVASTVFVTGHSYLATGFSTATTIRRLDRDGESSHDYGNLEDFALVVDGERVQPRDRNIWGVTFAADERTFFATASARGEQWLVRGDLAGGTLTSVRRNAECPSLSPDGRKVAYKKPIGEPAGGWAVAVLDLESGEETILGEERSVDDQVEWLDDETLLYGLPRPEEPGTSDVWAIDADGESAPTLFIRDAWSPSVVR